MKSTCACHLVFQEGRGSWCDSEKPSMALCKAALTGTGRWIGGYKRSRADPCVHLRKIGSEVTITNTFNNDTFGLSSTTQGANLAKKQLARIYEVKDLGKQTFILGMAIERDKNTCILE